MNLVDYGLLAYTLQANLKNAKPHISLTLFLNKMMCLLEPNTMLLSCTRNTNSGISLFAVL